MTITEHPTTQAEEIIKGVLATAAGRTLVAEDLSKIADAYGGPQSIFDLQNATDVCRRVAGEISAGRWGNLGGARAEEVDAGLIDDIGAALSYMAASREIRAAVSAVNVDRSKFPSIWDSEATEAVLVVLAAQEKRRREKRRRENAHGGLRFEVDGR